MHNMIEVKNKKYFSKGKRSIVYIGDYKNKKVIIKQSIGRINTIKNEAKFLKILNKYKIGPKLIYYDKNNLIYEFISGIKIIDWLKLNNKSKIRKILKSILDDCRLLDKLKINKRELKNPYKHILIDKIPKMIDFERCNFVKKQKNVTQFCQFLMSKKVYDILKNKDLKFNKSKLMKELRKYKKNYEDKYYKNILKIIMVES